MADRLIAQHEAALIRWMLDHAAFGDVAAFREQPIEHLRVREPGWCDCGCTSLDFAADHKGAKIIADATAAYPDGQKAGLILWGKDNQITLLEVYDMHPGASHRVPKIADLSA